MKRVTKDIFSVLLCVILGVIVTFIVFVLSFFIHESGHASFATMTAMSFRYPGENLTFYYQPVFGLNLPQQTGAVLPNSRIFSIFYELSGVTATFFFFSIIYLLLIAYNTKINQNPKLQRLLAVTLLIYIVNSIVENLLCGTDGLKLSCNSLFLSGFSLIAWTSFLFFIAFFFDSYITGKNRLK